MYSRKKSKKRYVIIFVIVVLILFFVFLYGTVNNKRKYTSVEKIFKDVGFLVTSVFKAPVDFTVNILNDMKEKNNIYEKYKEIKKDKDEIDKIKANRDELILENRKLKESLNIKNMYSEFDVINAKIVNRSMNFWLSYIDIDKGEKANIKPKMAVVNSLGLVGKVEACSKYSCKVSLLTSDDFDSFSVKIKTKDKFVYGIIASYDNNEMLFNVDGIDENTKISKGDLVTTTGVGDMFPAGIIIGKVEKVITDNFGLSRVVKLKASVNFNDLSILSVLKALK